MCPAQSIMHDTVVHEGASSACAKGLHGLRMHCGLAAVLLQPRIGHHGVCPSTMHANSAHACELPGVSAARVPSFSLKSGASHLRMHHTPPAEAPAPAKPQQNVDPFCGPSVH